MAEAPTLVVLAAGAGSRFGGPKQLAPIGPSGETLLEYAAWDAARSGFGRVVLVVREETEPAFRARFDPTMSRYLEVRYVHQGVSRTADGQLRKPWGTGHAVLAAREAVEGPFACINADDFYGRRSHEALQAFLREQGDGTQLAAVGFPLAGTLTAAGPVSRALLSVDQGRLSRIDELLEVWADNGEIVYRDESGESSRLDGQVPVSMNMWGFTARLLRDLGCRFDEFARRGASDETAEFRLPEVINDLVEEGHYQVRILDGSSVWCGLTYREDLEHVRSLIASLVSGGEYPEDLWA